MEHTQIKSLAELLEPSEIPQDMHWNLRLVKSEECLSYVAWNDQSREAIVIDPKQEDWQAYLAIARDLTDYYWLGVIDTHTHADHISAAGQLATELKAPLIMHHAAPSRRVQLRLGTQTSVLPAKSAPVQLLHTPGHTGDSVTVIWGPFIFGGDTILYGDTGRDDLPGGDPAAHYESVQLIKHYAKPEMILLPGHDHKGGRASTWKTQLEINTSLTQSREDFISEASAFNGTAPRLLKESLRENFK